MAKDKSIQWSGFGRRGRREGFTLIEVLVVVAIIALLIAILMPSLGRAREQARRASCAAQLKQIITGCHTYTANSNGWLPVSVKAFNASLTYMVYQHLEPAYLPPAQRGSYVHHGLLLKTKQMPNPEAFYCPSYQEYPWKYPDGWNKHQHGDSGKGTVYSRATSYMYALAGQVDFYPKGERFTARMEQMRPAEALLSCVFLGQIKYQQKGGLWPHEVGVNGANIDGSVVLKKFPQKTADQALSIYQTGNIDFNDYFAYCFFKALSGDHRWLNEYPKAPPANGL